MNLRSRVSGIVTGDQALFVRKDTYVEHVCNLQAFPVMEDIHLSKQLKKDSMPVCISTPVISSSRYWQQRGVLRSIVKMWFLRLLFFFNVSPKKLYKLYYSK